MKGTIYLLKIELGCMLTTVCSRTNIPFLAGRILSSLFVDCPLVCAVRIFVGLHFIPSATTNFLR